MQFYYPNNDNIKDKLVENHPLRKDNAINQIGTANRCWIRLEIRRVSFDLQPATN